MRHFAIALLLICTPAIGAEIPETSLVHAVLGEARSTQCSDFERQAIACATLNRGHLGGVYGAWADISKVRPKARARAVSAVKKARSGDITKGATHWLSRWDLRHCRPSKIAWRKKMRVTLKTKHFTFYKEAR